VNTQHLEEMGSKFCEALAKLKARHMMRSLPLHSSASVCSASVCASASAAAAAAAAAVGGNDADDDGQMPNRSTFVTDDDFSTYVILTPLSLCLFILRNP